MEKEITPYQVKTKMAVKANIRNKKTDKGGTFYVFDLYDEAGKLIAVDRYAFEGAIDLQTNGSFVHVAIKIVGVQVS